MNDGGCADPRGCDDTTKHLYEYQHHELDAEAYGRIKEHLMTCAHCRDLYQEEEVIRQRVKACACEAAPEQLRLRVVSWIATFRTTSG